MKRAVEIATLCCALCLMALAHGKEQHIMGTVTSISGTSITVATTAKKSVAIEITVKTKFEKSSESATPKDLKVGDKVVVHADVSGDNLIAREVRFGAAKAKQPMAEMK